MPLEVAPHDSAPDVPQIAATPSGLRHSILSPVETLAQSISAIAPTTSPALTIPLVFADSGNGAWLAYLLAASATLLVALCVARFARTSASPGSLYVYATGSLPPIASALAGWALALAYIATAASVAGGFVSYAHTLLPTLASHPTLLAFAATAAATALAWRDVQLSTRLMLLIEAASVSMILLVVLTLLFRHGPHIDTPQLTLASVSPAGVRLGVVLALFSFVGFESAASLGHEARSPLTTIPRVVTLSPILVGLLFLLCAYAETLGFRQLHLDLGQATSPFRPLSTLAGIPFLGPLIDIGAFVSMFACILACIIAAARILLRMAHDGLVPAILGRTHATNETPHLASLASGLATVALVCGLTLRGVSGADIYGEMGSLAVYGFITVYLLVALALPIFLRSRGQLTPAAIALSAAAALAMLAAMAGTLYPVPPAPYNTLPYLYLAILTLGLTFSYLIRRRHFTSPS